MQGLYGRQQALTSAIDAEVIPDKPRSNAPQLTADVSGAMSNGSESDKDLRLRHQGYSEAEWAAMEEQRKADAARAADASNATAPKPEPQQPTGPVIGPPPWSDGEESDEELDI